MTTRLLFALLLLAIPAHAQYTDAQIAQLEAFALKWERDAATLMSGQMPGGNRWEQIGRGLGLQRAADDIRLMLNRPIARTRANQPQPWPETDERGTAKLLELVTPGHSVPPKTEPVRVRPGREIVKP